MGVATKMPEAGSAAVAQAAAKLRENVSRVIVGKDDAITLLTVALLCEGHVLIEDVPGVGKTVLARSLARSVELQFQRVQFTPDLLPSDITGLAFFNQKSQEFQFRAGPVFTNVLLADEINRATPRTQSALLEAMAERQVTAEGETRALPRPFLVLATENPIELEGTFPLPEAQLDRFLLRVDLGYPTRDEERLIARRFQFGSPLDTLGSVLSGADLPALIEAVTRVHVAEAVEGYIVDLVRASREASGVALGASPRATLAMFRGSQALAAIHGRSFVLPDDVKRLALPVLGHRLILTSQSHLRSQSAAGVVAELLERVPAPVEDAIPAGS
jgi:MoxR-like ATPase